MTFYYKKIKKSQVCRVKEKDKLRLDKGKNVVEQWAKKDKDYLI
jgi:hypothetical protein